MLNFGTQKETSSSTYISPKHELSMSIKSLKSRKRIMLTKMVNEKTCTKYSDFSSHPYIPAL